LARKQTKKNQKKPTAVKLLFFDIETAPILAHVWGLFDQNVALNQIHTDWQVLSWSAKWLGSDEVMYADQRGNKKLNDKKLLASIWKLLDEADIVCTQNGKKFDVKKLNARFLIHGFQPPSSYKHIDTLVLARKYFGFTSNKLEYLSNTLNKNSKKLTHKQFPGFELWKECMKGNVKAWKEMEAYNKQDVLALEELYHKLIVWDGNSVNFNLYNDEGKTPVCSCGSYNFNRNGFHYGARGKYQRYRCSKCGAEYRTHKLEKAGGK
jgi:uncharacterized protein YprB with RNaseH-like and TPR domain